MGLFDLFKKKDQAKEPYTREQFNKKYRDYGTEIVEDWAKRNLPNINSPSVGEQIDTFKKAHPDKVVIVVKINEEDTFGLVAE